MGYFKDISADRQTGYNTFPVRFGWRANSIYSDLVALGAAVGSGASIWLSGRLNWLGAAVFVAGFLINVWAQVAIHRIRDEAKSHGPIANVVRAFVLYGLAMVLTMKPGWVLPAALFYGAFELVLKLRPERAQV
jgi:4-hydroxybenzoate polyprenyltransferase